MTIKKFIINTVDKSLSVLADIHNTKDKLSLLSFEYLRISSPNTVTNKQSPTIISHKKQVQLLAIEPVARHGYRFIFDDQHAAIYSDSYLQVLITEQSARWQTYLDDLKSSGHTREAMISIKQV